MDNKHTIGDLYQMQALPLKYKIIMTQQRIRGWYDHFDGNVYVSFSGGKDSTVLVDIITKMGYTDIPLVFVDTGLEYPEIREFVRGGYGDRVTWLKPKMVFKEVIEKYGYPFISKEISESIAGLQTWLSHNIDPDSDEPKMQQIRRKIIGGEIDINDVPVRMCYLLGMYDKYNRKQIEVSRENKSVFCKEKWQFLIDAEFRVSNQCCDIMKKGPIKAYSKETGRVGITAQMAEESKLRTKQWLKNGCNGFEMKSPISNPMSFWTEQDVLLYIKQNNLPICSVYGEIVEDLEGTEEVEGQMTMSDIEGWEDQHVFDAERPTLRTTGCHRTGCMFCGFGCHLEKEEGRFESMRRTHPKQYDYIMRPWEEGGLNYKAVIDYINENGGCQIKY